MSLSILVSQLQGNQEVSGNLNVSILGESFDSEGNKLSDRAGFL